MERGRVAFVDTRETCASPSFIVSPTLTIFWFHSGFWEEHTSVCNFLGITSSNYSCFESVPQSYKISSPCARRGWPQWHIITLTFGTSKSKAARAYFHHSFPSFAPSLTLSAISCLVYDRLSLLVHGNPPRVLLWSV